MRLNPHRLTCLCSLWIAFVLVPVEISAQSEEATDAPKWSETDSRLANHYLRLLQKKPEYGNVLDLLWDLYEKKNQTPLLMEYLDSAAKPEDAYIPKLIYAHLLRKAERVDEAKPFYDQVAAGLPENIPALKALAEIAEQQDRESKALSYYTRLMKLIPATEDDGVAIRFRKAAIHQARRQTKLAVTIWNHLLRARPNDAKMRNEVVSMLLEVGETSGAIEVLEQQATARDVKVRLAALDELTRVYELINDFEGATRAARDAMAVLHFKNHQHRGFFERLVKLHERFDRLPELETRLKDKVDQQNPGESSLYQLAAFYQLTADYQEEEATLVKLVERLPKSIDYRVRLAELQLANDRYADSADTLDAILEDQESVPHYLMFLRVKVDLSAEDELAAEQRLSEYLKSNSGDSELREKIMEFARANYLDNLVEKMLRESVEGDITGSDGDSAPLALARFLHERGRKSQAREVIEKFVAGSGESTTVRSKRLHQAALAYRDLDMTTDSVTAIDEALSIQPENVDFLSTRAGLQVDRGESEAAIKTLETVWRLQSVLEEKTEIDQKIFSLLRANTSSGIVEPEPVLPSGPIRSAAEYRRLAAALANSKREADSETPRILKQYYENLVAQANRLRTVEARYRAAWWALKLQDNHEVYFQLNAAKRDVESEGGKPVVEVEEMLLELAVQNERPENVVRHLETLCEIDPDHFDEYRQQWAEAKFYLGSEDVAVRELKKLAAKPNASLQTIATLSKIYGEQGNWNKQIQVWETAYRKANLFDKRRIIRQLTSALLEQKKPQAALKAQMDLVERETDQLQRRKQFESQLTVASRNYLLDWLKDNYLKAVQKKPFDRFFPEALGRIQLAMGNHREAFDSMKKAYYMSGQNDELLDELGDLASRLGDLNSAIYYSRQMISRGEGEANIENWENLIVMLEKDFRSSEADLMRGRLEVKFGQDPDFLERLATLYRKNDRLVDAHRVYRKRAKLRDWDVSALFDLALVKQELGDRDGARPLFETIIESTGNEALPDWTSGGLWPLIDSTPDSEQSLTSLNFELQTFPLISTEVEEEFTDWTESRNHPEFRFRPRDKYAIRLRALEELGKCIRHSPTRDKTVLELLAGDLLSHEKWWIAHHSLSGEGMTYLYNEDYPKHASALASFSMANGLVRSGNLSILSELEPDHSDQFTLASAAVFSAYLARKNQTVAHLSKLVAFLADRDLHPATANHIFNEWKKKNHFAAALRFRESVSDSPQFSFLAAQVADWMGESRKQVELLDHTLGGDLNLEYGGTVPTIYQIAIADRFRISDSPEERESLLGSVRKKISIHSEATDLTRFQIEALLGHISGDYEASFAALESVSAEFLKLKPRPYGNEIRFSRNYFGWERLQQELRFYTGLIPREPRQTDWFARSFGGGMFSQQPEDALFRVYEFYEAFRAIAWLNGKSAVDRSVLIDQAIPGFQSLDGRLELARNLEKFGYHREAADVYYREVIAGSEDYAPIRGLFKSSNLARSPELGLDVIEKLNSGTLPAPPGLTVSYISEQHARLLWHSRNLELLAQLSQPPTSRPGEPPVKTTSHLPYQRELIHAYRHSGESESLLRLLTHQKNRNESTGRDLLLGSDLLIANGSYTEALNWLDQISYARKDIATELRALNNYFRIFELRKETTRKELKWLSRIALQYRSRPLTAKLANLFIERGESGEALSLLRIHRRNEKDPSARSELQLMILDTVAKTMPDDEVTLRKELGVYLGGMNDTATPGQELARWSATNAGILEVHLPVFQSFRNHPRAGPVSRLIAAWLNSELPAEFASLKEESTPAEFESMLPVTALLGDEGRGLVRGEVESSGRAGPAFFAGQPETQLWFFSLIEDRNRLLECHAALMRMAESYFFFGRVILPEYPTLQRHWKLPGLLAELGHDDLANTLFAKFYANIRHFRPGEIPFVEGYVDFLIDREDFETAERVLIDVTRHSLGFDLRKIVKLCKKWDTLASIEEYLPRFGLTTGQIALVKEWRTAVVEGREMVEYTAP